MFGIWQEYWNNLRRSNDALYDKLTQWKLYDLLELALKATDQALESREVINPRHPSMIFESWPYLDRVKAIVIGMEPVPDPGEFESTGAFTGQIAIYDDGSRMQLPRSISNILLALNKSFGGNRYDYNSDYLKDNGILFLNMITTSRRSRGYGNLDVKEYDEEVFRWKRFNTELIKKLLEFNENLVVLEFYKILNNPRFENLNNFLKNYDSQNRYDFSANHCSLWNETDDYGYYTYLDRVVETFKEIHYYHPWLQINKLYQGGSR